MQEYNNLPLRFSRQLSLDQMNEAVDYVNAVVEGKKAASSADQGMHAITSAHSNILTLKEQELHRFQTIAVLWIFGELRQDCVLWK